MAVHFTSDYKLKFGYPWVSLPTDAEAEKMSTDDLKKFMEIWSDINNNGKKNPVGHGWTLPSWEVIFDNWDKYSIFILLGGNASGKSVFGARSVLSLAAMIPEASLACFSPSAETSIADQQRLVYESLPDVLKNMPTSKGKHHALSWSQKNGFSDGVCILPPLPGYRNGSTIRFYNYNQWFQNDTFIEGKRFHYVWLDEECPIGLFDTIRLGRIGAYHGKILNTWTVINNWNPTVEKIMARTKTIKNRFCDHPKVMSKIPILQESLSMASTLVSYAWGSDNNFVDWNQFLVLNAAEPKDVILARGYGVPTRLTTSAFPLFDKEVNVIKHEDLPWLKAPKINARGVPVPYRVTRYMAVDPGGSKNWFMLWGCVDGSGTWYFYREWPDISLGEWALPGDKPGPGQKGTGISIEKYVETINQVEEGEEIMERYIDPRMGNNERGGTTIVSELDDNDMVMTSATVASSDTNKTEIEDGIQVINDLLHWNPAEPRSFTNAPKLYISDRCENLIYAFQEFTGKLGPTEATKDPLDCTRYLLKSNVGFVDASAKDNNRTGVY